MIAGLFRVARHPRAPGAFTLVAVLVVVVTANSQLLGLYDAIHQAPVVLRVSRCTRQCAWAMPRRSGGEGRQLGGVAPLTGIGFTMRERPGASDYGRVRSPSGR